jgi:hypothetical protein
MPQPERTKIHLTTLKDLLSNRTEETEWLWEDRLVVGSLSICAAKPKVGKSTLARNLALAVARGELFLRGSVKKGPVVYLALEERAEDLAADFRTMGADGGEDIAFADRGLMQNVIEMVRERKPVLLVIDPLFRLVRVKDEKGYAELYNALGPLIDVGRETGTHILCLHHSSKLPRSDAIDSPIGSTALGGAVSTLLIMRRTDSYRTLQTVQRIGEDLREVVLEFDPDTKILSLGGDRKNAEVAELEKRIMDFLSSQNRSLTEPEINAGVAGRNEHKRRAIRKLTDQDLVVRIGTGRRNDPFHYRIACILVPDSVEESRDHKPDRSTLT